MEINQQLHEALGRCWHEWNGASSGMTCIRCDIRVACHNTSPPPNPNYCDDPRLVLEAMRGREDWHCFQQWAYARMRFSGFVIVIMDKTGLLAEDALEWLGEKE